MLFSLAALLASAGRREADQGRSRDGSSGRGAGPALSLVAVRRARAAAGWATQLPVARAVFPGRVAGRREEGLTVGAAG